MYIPINHFVTQCLVTKRFNYHSDNIIADGMHVAPGTFIISVLHYYYYRYYNGNVHAFWYLHQPNAIIPVTGSLERSLGASTPIINVVIYTSKILPRDSFQHFVSEKSTIFKSVRTNGRFFLHSPVPLIFQNRW